MKQNYYDGDPTFIPKKCKHDYRIFRDENNKSILICISCEDKQPVYTEVNFDEHTCEEEYIPFDAETQVPEQCICKFCSKEMEMIEPDFDLMREGK